MSVVPRARWAKLLATNTTDAAFIARPPVLTTPSFEGVLTPPPAAAPGQPAPFLSLILFGAGTDNYTASARALGWSRTAAGLWLPSVLWQGVATLSTYVGVAGGDAVTTDRFADTITTTAGGGVDGVTCQPLGLADNSIPAHVVLDARNHEIVSVELIVGGGGGTAATNANAFFRWL